jgi:hypothetical protein
MKMTVNAETRRNLKIKVFLIKKVYIIGYIIRQSRNTWLKMLQNGARKFNQRTLEL